MKIFITVNALLVVMKPENGLVLKLLMLVGINGTKKFFMRDYYD